MDKSRLEAFSDGVFAILITIMVLDFKVPGNSGWQGAATVVPTLSGYLLSFVYIGIYWNNHHHMMKLAPPVNGGVLWANLHLLFWLSLVPFTTRWMDESGFAAVPVFIYGSNLLLAAVAYTILQSALIRLQGSTGTLAGALGRNLKGMASPVIYVIGCAAALALPLLALAAYAVVAALWLVPDRRLERAISA
ncbi:putative membrane protein [Arthrobacter sp. GAS37]|uniref:TMEM175 family protein n=1 Tax=Arthrobacter sp. GAS37 TaxID=3156261 RepID=UPI00383875AB